MRFGPIPVEGAAGALLVHSLKAEGVSLRKGRRLTESDVGDLLAAGVASVTVLALDAGDVTEDEAAARLAGALSPPGIRIGEAATGRVNLYAVHNGLFRVDAAAVDGFNAVDPALTLATLNDRASVRAGDMVATVKIIPLAVPGTSLDAGVSILERPGVLAVKPFATRRVGLVATTLASLKPSVMDKTRSLIDRRLKPSGSAVVEELRVPHETAAVTDAILRLTPDCDMVLVFGASAVSDPEDVIPAAIRAAGGHVESVGMPVDPGNLLVLGALEGKPVIGAPGCARSPKENGFDWVLDRLLAGETVGRGDIAALGVGGLLMEIPTRPQPRNAPPTEAEDRQVRLRVHGVLLAAGRASRMGEGGHKLLAEFGGVPLVRRVADKAATADLEGLVVVTGHRRAEIEAALDGVDATVVFNPDYADGMATSLSAGVAALGDTDGALILLGDMPRIGTGHLDLLIGAFREAKGQAVVRAANGRNRGNPVVLPASTFEALRALSGDVGARHVIQTSGLPVIDVDIGEAAEVDVDTPDAVVRAGGVLKA